MPCGESLSLTLMAAGTLTCSRSVTFGLLFWHQLCVMELVAGSPAVWRLPGEQLSLGASLPVGLTPEEGGSEGVWAAGKSRNMQLRGGGHVPLWHFMVSEEVMISEKREEQSFLWTLLSIFPTCLSGSRSLIGEVWVGY